MLGTAEDGFCNFLMQFLTSLSFSPTFSHNWLLILVWKRCLLPLDTTHPVYLQLKRCPKFRAAGRWSHVFLSHCAWEGEIWSSCIKWLTLALSKGKFNLNSLLTFLSKLKSIEAGKECINCSAKSLAKNPFRLKITPKWSVAKL